MKTYRACYDVGTGIAGRVVRDFQAFTLRQARIAAITWLGDDRAHWQVAYVTEL